MHNKFLKTILIFGMGGGLLTFLYFMIVYWAGANPFYGFFQKLIMIPKALILLAGLYYYKVQLKSHLSFGKSVLTGFLMNFCIVLISSFMIFLTIRFAEPGMITKQIETLKNYMIEQKETLVNRSSEKAYRKNFESLDQINAYSLAVDRFIRRNITDLMFVFLISMVFAYTGSTVNTFKKNNKDNL